MGSYNLQIRRIKNTKIEEAFCDFLANKDTGPIWKNFGLNSRYISDCDHNFNGLYFILMGKNNYAPIFEA